MTKPATDPKQRWGVFCSAAEHAGCKLPRFVAWTRREAEMLKREAERECQTPGSKHTVRRLP